MITGLQLPMLSIYTAIQHPHIYPSTSEKEWKEYCFELTFLEDCTEHFEKVKMTFE